MNTWFTRSIRQFSSHIAKYKTDMVRSYEEAVRTLNTLQSNAATLEKARKERDRKRHLNIPQTIQFLQRSGLSTDALDKLSVIHVSGTKGKGSTCAFCESILRHHGYKTGFYSSPHLIEVRERIRINGKPLSKEAFSNYFWDCYNKLDRTKEEYEGAMPAYFRFLTIMALNVFLQEKVDVAIMEVGIGGQYDCTNVVRTPVVCGVSSLGMDHLSILGDTIEQIAWHKAGIFKPGVPAMTVPQPGGALQVLMDRAKETGIPLRVVPELATYDWGENPMSLGISGNMQYQNASLALQLCKTWMKDHQKSIKERQASYNLEGAEDFTMATGFPISKSMATGLENCRWHGRNQVLRSSNVTYYLDGAHTTRSMQHCVDWFKKASFDESLGINGKVLKVLLFNATGDRLPDTLLEPLVACNFDSAAFCPNNAFLAKEVADQTNLMVTKDSQLRRVIQNRNMWLHMVTEYKDYLASTGGTPNCHQGDGNDSGLEVLQKYRSKAASLVSDAEDSGYSDELPEEHSDNTTVASLACISDALAWAGLARDSSFAASSKQLPTFPEGMENIAHVQVLVTGSLHLVGGALKVLDPELNDRV